MPSDEEYIRMGREALERAQFAPSRMPARPSRQTQKNSGIETRPIENTESIRSDAKHKGRRREAVRRATATVESSSTWTWPISLSTEERIAAVREWEEGAEGIEEIAGRVAEEKRLQANRESSIWWSLLAECNILLCAFLMVLGGILTVRRLHEDSYLSGLFAAGIAALAGVLCARHAIDATFREVRHQGDEFPGRSDDHRSGLAGLLVLLLLIVAYSIGLWGTNEPSWRNDLPPEAEQFP